MAELPESTIMRHDSVDDEKVEKGGDFGEEVKGFGFADGKTGVISKS